MVTRTERPPIPGTTVDEFVAFIDKLIQTIDSDDDLDGPTERMDFLEEKTEIKRATKPPPLPPRDPPADSELIALEDSLLPTQF